MSRNYREIDLKLLWGRSAARCAFPDCPTELTQEGTHKDPAVVIGEMAHIVAGSQDENRSPRYDPAYPRELLDTYENLILLCPTHHTLVDKQHNTYTVDDLKTWKSELEDWVAIQLSKEIPNVGFAELEILTNGILGSPGAESVFEKPLDPREKMARNQLTEKVGFELRIGLSKAHEVRSFVSGVARLDPRFPERLKAGFTVEYRRLVEMGVIGDALFEGLVDFASSGKHEFRYRAAGLAVLAYLFEVCEVFER